VRVWIDQDLCTGDGLCTDHCPDLFVLLDDGISYVRNAVTGVINSDPGGRACQVSVPSRFEASAIDAALACPGECIFLEEDAVLDGFFAETVER
jgi:ferredoxin